MLRTYTFFGTEEALVSFTTVASSLEEAERKKNRGDGDYDTYDYANFEWDSSREAEVSDLSESMLRYYAENPPQGYVPPIKHPSITNK